MTNRDGLGLRRETLGVLARPWLAGYAATGRGGQALSQHPEEPVNDRPPALTRAQLEDLKARHIAFLQARLRSTPARKEWRANIAAVLAEMVQKPLAELIEVRATIAALDAALSRALFDTSIRPVLDQLVARLHAAGSEARGSLGELVPEKTRGRLDALLARPDLIPPKLVQEIAEHEAAREVLRDVLRDALRQFSTRVNPFVADWGLPALLKKLGPLGGGMGKSFEGMRAEFERRLDPEIQKFLEGFSRDALHDMANSVIARGATPSFVALRQRIGRFLIEQRIAELSPDAEASRLAGAIGLDIAAHVLSNEAVAAQRRASVERWFAEHALEPVNQLLKQAGLPEKPPEAFITALADATFPAFSAALMTPTARQWLSMLVAEFYDGIAAADDTQAPA